VVETDVGWVLAQAAASIELADVSTAWNTETAPAGSGQSETVSHIQQLYLDNQRVMLQGTVQDALERWS
jgi:DNA-binding IscR family transcriptional regulator